jgi:hypothetical protein
MVDAAGHALGHDPDVSKPLAEISSLTPPPRIQAPGPRPK